MSTEQTMELAEVARYGAKKLGEIDLQYVTPKISGAINSAIERFWLIARTAKERAPSPSNAPGEVAGGGIDSETIQTLLGLLNPLHGDLDNQTYDAKVAMDFDMPPDYAHDVTVTAQQERDLTQAVLILEDRKRSATLSPGGGEVRKVLEPFAKAWTAYGEKPSDETRLSNNRDEAYLEGTLITFGDLRRAHEVLAALSAVPAAQSDE
jgi:hypothetical protein